MHIEIGYIDNIPKGQAEKSRYHARQGKRHIYGEAEGYTYKRLPSTCIRTLPWPLKPSS